MIETYIDPPEGWKHGFPKVIPENVKPEDINDWLVKNGYPKEKIIKYGEQFYYRKWQDKRNTTEK